MIEQRGPSQNASCKLIITGSINKRVLIPAPQLTRYSGETCTLSEPMLQQYCQGACHLSFHRLMHLLVCIHYVCNYYPLLMKIKIKINNNNNNNNNNNRYVLF